VLRTAYRRPEGSIGYRCAGEPQDVYLARKGGRLANQTGRRCLCNALFAAAGLAQQRASGYLEPPIVTSGSDFSGVRAVLQRNAPRAGRPAPADSYTAADIIDYLLT